VTRDQSKENDSTSSADTSPSASSAPDAATEKRARSEPSTSSQPTREPSRPIRRPSLEDAPTESLGQKAGPQPARTATPPGVPAPLTRPSSQQSGEFLADEPLTGPIRSVSTTAPEDAVTSAEYSPPSTMDSHFARLGREELVEDLLDDYEFEDTQVTRRSGLDHVVDREDRASDELLRSVVEGPKHLSEGEEAISDTFRRALSAPRVKESLPHLKARFIGRSKHLQALKTHILSARKQGTLRFVTLVGEPGCGKTRIAREFARSVRAAIPDARVLWGAATRTAARPYEAVAQLLAERFGVSRDEAADDARLKIEHAIFETMPAKLHRDTPTLVARLMQIPQDNNPLIESLGQTPKQLELRSYIALMRFFKRDAERGPLLLCFDDMQLATNETINLVHYLADGLKGAPLMILAAGRPTLFRKHPQWAQGDFESHRVDVGSMAPEESESLFLDLCRLPAAPRELTEVARDNLGGNPRSIFEFSRLLLESGVLVANDMRWQVSQQRLEQVTLTRTHEDILRARLHGLPRNERALLQMASAIGETFWLDAIVALVRSSLISGDDPDGPSLEQIATVGESIRHDVIDALSLLCQRGLLVRSEQSGIAGEQEYHFAYPPIWDLTYEMLADDRRKRYHRLAAQWLEARPEGREAARQEQVGRHFERAGDMRAAAARYRRAADASRSEYFNHKAIRLYQHALACLGETDLVTRLHLWHDLGSVFQHTGDFDSALDAFERMVRLGWVVASRPKAAVAFNKMGRVWRQKGNLNLALEYLRRGLEMFRQANDERGVATSLDDIGQVHWMLGRYDEALDHGAKALEMRRQMGDQRSIALSLSNIGNIEKDRGLFDEAEACYREALRLRRAVSDIHGQIVSLNNIAALAYERGELDDARDTWDEALAEAERIGAVPLQVVVLNNLGEMAARHGKVVEAHQRLQRAITLATEIDDQRTYIDVLRNLSQLQLLDGNAEKARKYARECLTLARKARLPEMIGKAHIALAEIHAQTLFDASGEASNSAQGYYQQAIGVFREMGHEAELARALRRLGEYLIERGQQQPGLKVLREAVAIFAKLNMPDAVALQKVLDDLDETGPSLQSR
jgi:tetratricopeptide (TPR) repeat protein